MNNLLTNRGRNLFSMLLVVCGLLVMAGMIPSHLRVPVSDFWKDAGVAIQMITVFILLGIAGYLNYRPLTSVDLLQAVERSLGDEIRVIEAWKSIRTKHLTFKDMSVWEKIGYLLLLLTGIVCWVYALVDMLGYIPLMRLRAIDNSIQTISRWETVLVEIVAGFALILIAQLLRFKLVDRWEERFKQLLREVEDETGGKSK